MRRYSKVINSSIEYAINGERFEQAGTVSMDYSMVFLREKQFNVGTEVTLLGGKAMHAKEWADKAQTISYEITTRLHPAIKREFLD